MVIRLPIELNTAVITECWTFEKLAMIQAAPCGDAWLASHLSLCMDPHFSCYFGDWDTHYSPSYYDDVLSVREIPLYSSPEADLLDRMQAHIRDGRYVMAILHHGPDDRDDRNAYHESLLYGYDSDRRVFFAPVLRNTELVEGELPFESVLASLSRLKAHMIAVPDDRFFWASGYQFPLSCITVRTDYVPNPYAVLQKFIPEIWGNTMVLTELDMDMQPYGEKAVYRGLGCLWGIREALTAYRKGEPMPDGFIGFVRNFKKLCEHRRLFLHSMHYMVRQWSIHNEDVDTCVRVYSACVDRVETWLSLSIKAEITRTPSLLSRIVDEIPAAYREEFLMLSDFYNRCLIWYRDHHTVL